MWLVIENKVNTWDNLIRKGWTRPNICFLCKCDEESVRHLFVYCAFARETINFLHMNFNCLLIWTDISVLENIENWLNRNADLLYLPFFFIWNLLKTLNFSIFEDKKPDLNRLGHIIMHQVNAYQVSHSIKSRIRNIGSDLVLTYPTWFFDGATANQTGGAGIFLLISQTHYFYIILGCGKSTNTRAKLLSLWALLYFTK